MTSTEETKYALVTGASSGIGRATAIELASRGFKVFACARRVDKMAELVKYDIETIGLDVTDAKNVSEVRDIISAKTGGKLHILFNNAGQSCTMPASDLTDEMVKACFDVNVLAPIRMTKEFTPLLINAKGCVAFTGSLAGIFPFPFGSVYGASKAAIHQFASGLHLEMKPFGVKVLNIVTGGVDTDIADTRPLPESSIYYCPATLDAFAQRQRMAKLNKPMAPEVFAKAIVDDMVSEARPVNVYRGSKATYIRYVTALVPRFLIEFFVERKFLLVPVFAYLREKYSKAHLE